MLFRSKLLLPGPRRVADAVTGEDLGVRSEIAWTADGVQTRLFLLSTP